MEFEDTRWRKSSRSNGYGGDCVEVAITREFVGVRDTKDRDGGTLTLARPLWTSFVTGLKTGSINRS
jgi:hypothetical protein